MKKKYCLFIPSMRGGGAEKVVALLSSFLANKEDAEVYLLVMREEGVYWDLIIDKVNIVVLNKKRALHCIVPLIKWIKVNKPDIIFSALNYANLIVAIARSLSGINCKHIMSEHGRFYIPYNIGSYIYKAIFSFYYNKADLIVAVSDGIKKEIVENLSIDANKVVVINNPAFPSKKVINKVDLSNYFKVVPSKLIISIGRLDPLKNFINLLTAYKLLNKKDIGLVILGEGNQRAMLEKYIKKNNLDYQVLLPGFVKDPYIWLNTADLFVSSSDSEAFGNAIVEAMAYGLNIVSTRCDGPCEILNNGEFGILVPINDSENLCEAINNILLNKNLFDKVKIQERAKSFSQENIFKKYDDIFES
ncbi:glycosyltransferase [Acinetobacter towneri]|uniref:glycosyltransferase n=1 Tax=Acinetobacter towneri TaxID=202956 RepID=UPI002097BB21|nr:glycosyltransferase [Acinetobacter towneri]MCO8048560.1 glycosyltransferase [Acinetobacter towneri]